MNVNKYVNKLHKELDIVLDEMIIHDLNRMGDVYFKKYQPLIDEINAIVDECYSYNVMSEEQYDKIVHRFADICVSVNGEERLEEISDMLHTVLSDNYDKYCEAIFDMVVTPLLQVAKQGRITKERCILEDRRAENRLNKRRKRLVDMYINEIDSEFISVIFFARDALISYGKAGRVIWNDEDEEHTIEIEVEENKYIKMTEVDEVIEWLEERSYKKVRQAGTSHAIYSNGQHSVPVPVHGKTINTELAYGIQRQVIRAAENN